MKTPRPVSRRGVLALGVGGLAGSTAGCAAGSARAATPAPRASVARWNATRGPHYYIAHRGSGDVLPEHSLPAYRAALGWGAPCLEVSVAMTSDGVLVCLHDLTYDRTTTGHGLVAAQPSSVLDHIGIRVPQLGPAWLRSPLPRVPRLADALALLGGRAVLALEAKNDAAYRPMMAMATKLGLRNSVIVKAFHTSPRIAEAKAAGYPVFAYLGPGEATEEAIGALAARLDPHRDYLGIPTPSAVSVWPDALVRGAVAHGVPVWMYPVHRRSEAAAYFGLGVAGVVTSSYGYSTHRVPRATNDDWASKAVASGQISRSPATDATAPTWTGADELTLGAGGAPQLLTLGQLSPVAAPASNPGSYRILLEARWAPLPTDQTAGLCLAFARPDDRYYQVGVPADGYNAVISPDGTLRLLRHDRNDPTSRLLAQARLPPIAAGQPMSVQLVVTGSRIRWQVSTGGRTAAVDSADTAHRGGYLHVGRLSTNGALVLRDLVVAPATASG